MLCFEMLLNQIVKPVFISFMFGAFGVVKVYCKTNVDHLSDSGMCTSWKVPEL